MSTGGLGPLPRCNLGPVERWFAAKRRMETFAATLLPQMLPQLS